MNYLGTDLVSGGWDAIDNILATGTPFPAQQRLTIQLRGMWEPREVIVETPREGSPEGKDVRNLNQIVEKGAEVIKAGKSWIGGVYDQVKGLFNLGFDQTGKQPVFSIEHEIEPTVKIGIGVIAAAVILVLLLRKR